jgi:hypothetical protein
MKGKLLNPFCDAAVCIVYYYVAAPFSALFTHLGRLLCLLYGLLQVPEPVLGGEELRPRLQERALERVRGARRAARPLHLLHQAGGGLQVPWDNIQLLRPLIESDGGRGRSRSLGTAFNYRALSSDIILFKFTRFYCYK